MYECVLGPTAMEREQGNGAAMEQLGGHAAAVPGSRRRTAREITFGHRACVARRAICEQQCVHIEKI